MNFMHESMKYCKYKYIYIYIYIYIYYIEAIKVIGISSVYALLICDILAGDRHCTVCGMVGCCYSQE